MPRSLTPRPWYVLDRLVEDYRAILSSGGDLQMLRALKITRSIIVNVGLFAIVVLAIQEGIANPFVVGIAIATIGLYNGVELADYQALARAVIELQGHTPDDQDDDED